MLSSSEIRRRFLDFFASRGHTVVASSSLVPGDDPTLLFTNAGMVQFKSVFLGEEARDYRRATTAQKCVRAGGKHNDLENVGVTTRHHTFFEMLGNFSFGDYFKREAIHYAWELLTAGFGLDPRRLWVTVFEEDDEAARIWLDEVGVDPVRFSRIGAKDNFWSMGEIGPCGPCSEIFFDHGAEIAGGPPGSATADGDRYVEIWNLVFMQFNREKDGTLTPLPRPSVDTGMGLERIAAVLQGVHDNYATDCFTPLIEAVRALAPTPDADGARVSERVVADHLRSVAFLLADGVVPANDGRGYVLRRILRRAARHGRRLGFTRPFLAELLPALIDQMGVAYPELAARREQIVRTLVREESRFLATLDHGLALLGDALATLGAEAPLPGEVAFRLYDTYGFPLDLTRDVCAEAGRTVDEAGFEQAMEHQRSRARASWKGGEQSESQVVYRLLLDEVGKSRFTGYEQLEGEATLRALVRDGVRVATAKAGDAVELILDTTPFYGESGGQAGDRGVLVGAGVEVEVTETKAPVPGLICHRGRLLRGALATGVVLTARVDRQARAATACNHTGTHLLQAALREVLGDHVRQAGSLVAPDRLRFDFHHFAPIDTAQLREVERRVNEEIWRHQEVVTRKQGLEEAVASGAMALFGERYGDTVRVVSVGDFSKELCGGTHVGNSGDIGLLVIEREQGIAAGVRRIEAATSSAALAYLQRQGERLAAAAAVLKADPEQLTERLIRAAEHERELKGEVERLRRKLAEQEASQGDHEEVNGVAVVVRDLGDSDTDSMRQLADSLRAQGRPFVALLAARSNGKPLLLCAVDRSVTDRVQAGAVVKQVGRHIGGGGGGRPDLAQAGGKRVEGIAAALAEGAAWVRERLAG